MALQAWLPLNKSVNRNCGLNNGISATNTAVFSSTGSPVNGCYTFTTGQSITLSGVDFSKLKTCSISLWVYQNTKKNTVFFTGPSTSHYVIASQTDGTSDFYHSGNVGGTKKTYVDGVQAVKLGSAGAWHHYVITDVNLSAWTGTTLYFNNYSSGFNFAGRVCDIRIYDNVLTDEDVKELYRNNVYHFVPFWKHNSVMQFGDAAYFGTSINQTSHDVTQSGSSLYFNGTSSYIDFPGMSFTGGTLSVWINFASKPSAQKVIYYDPVAKMILAFLSDGNFGTGIAAKSRYASTGMTWGQWNHVVAEWNSAGTPTGLWVNGVAAATTGTTTNWSTGGTTAAIGKRLGVSSSYENPMQGYVNSIRVYTKQLIQAEVLEIYNRGPENKEEILRIPKEYTELRYIQSTGTQYIDTGVNPRVKPRVVARFEFLDGNDKDYWGNGAVNGSAYYADFSGRKLAYYRYGSTTYFAINYTANLNELHEWDVSDKVYVDGVLKGQTTNTYTYSSSQSTIQIFKAARANYYSSYKLYEFKLYDGDELVRHFIPTKRNSDDVIGLYDIIGKSFYTNKGTGTFTAGPVVIDGYTVLDYIEATGTQWIDTNVSGFNNGDWQIYCKWKVTAAPTGNYAYVFGVYENENTNSYRLITQTTSTTNYYVSAKSKAGSSIGVTNLATANTHTISITGNTFAVDGTSYTASTTGTALSSATKMGLFKTPAGSVYYKGRIYAFWTKKDGNYVSILVPAKRNSDNVVGMYDIIRKTFLTNSGTGTFTAGAAV